MSNIITVNMADFNVAKSPDTLVTLGIGSCVAVCLYQRDKKLGGLAHIMLPWNENNDRCLTGKYADTAIAELIRQMIRYGAAKNGIVAKVIGGASVLLPAANPTYTIGSNNIKAVKETLSENRISISAEDVGGQYGRGVAFNTETGAIEITVLSQPARRFVL